MKNLLLLTPLFLLACWDPAPENTSEPLPTPQIPEKPVTKIYHPEGDHLAERITPPAGYQRLAVQEGSFAEYLRNFPLMPHGSLVYTCDSSIIPNDHYYCAVLQIDVGKKDLQQCADAVMRLKAEYHYGKQEYDSIHFNLTNGFRMNYSAWKEGKRLVVKGNQTYWKNSAAPSTDYASFRRYLDRVYTYAGTLSLSKELKPASIDRIVPGEVFIQGGSPGHAVIVMDVAENAEGERLFLLAQSYMPAQNIHVLVNRNEPDISPWYRAKESQSISTPAWHFYSEDLMAFPAM
ncbi:DUF4846 domain-containing protein [bacterium SCSIO 12741]|nr:DUF4846 domain-containing protein [bacterium SCSIO 12741]